MKTSILLISLLSLALFGALRAQQPNYFGQHTHWLMGLKPNWSDALSEGGATKRTPREVKQIVLRSGLPLEYAIQGPANAAPILLVHGFPDSWHSYEQVMDFLPADQRVLAVSLRGHGNSGSPDTGYTAKQLAADVAELMTLMNLPPALVVGHSMGSVVAQQLAIDFPERVTGLVLEGGFAYFSQRELYKELKEMAESLTDPVDTMLIREFQTGTTALPVQPDFFELLIHESRKVKAKVWKEVMRGVVANDCRPSISQYRKPLLLIWGDQDNIALKADQDFFLKNLPACQIKIYGGAGHSAHWEQPRRFADDLLKFASVIRFRRPGQVEAGSYQPNQD